ncbi:PilN domain-containing protein [Acidocella aromatica]|uniref:General secretion pathway protein L n=1 Tax=Acidocella aromatica TaxID=1303579 RepID=A0A840V937_9PROT|nr:PilN domain-containing protein [Acidocella aromatica]MBB5372213.1 general secretion pathway protein L [Acidocella aromatica]
MLTSLFAWWTTQLRALLPPAIARHMAAREMLIIDIDRMDDIPQGSLLLRRDGQERFLHGLQATAPAMARLATGLRLPRGAVLSREVTLPYAALRDLPAVLCFEMDRLTPFAADELVWSVSRIRPDKPRGLMKLHLTFALRAPVEALLARLTRLHLAPGFIESKTGRIELARPRHGSARPRWASLPAACAVLALLCLVAPFIRQQIALNQAAQAIADAAPAAHAAMVLRHQLAVTASGRSAIAAARNGGDALHVLALLTGALPDGTWISDLTVKSGDLTIDGQSDNAAQLIGLLSAVPGLHDPGFTAPVTRTADGKADLFALHATVGP